MVSVILVSYNRPIFLKECIRSLIENAGTDFELIVWDNGCNQETRKLELDLQRKYGFELLLNDINIGQQAWGHLLKHARGEYFVLTEDDMIWFQPNWLKSLVEAFETKPPITPEGFKMGFKNKWGILATNVMVDTVNNGGMWKKRFEHMIEVDSGGYKFWTNIRAGAGAMIWNTEILRNMNVMVPEVAPFNKALDRVIDKYDQEKYAQAQVRDIYIYHAASPYFNQLFPEVWQEKQIGQSVEEAFKIYNKLGNFKFKDKSVLNKLKNGTFKQYAQNLYKIFNNGRGRVYSFELAEKTPRQRSSYARHKIKPGCTQRKTGKRNHQKI